MMIVITAYDSDAGELIQLNAWVNNCKPAPCRESPAIVMGIILSVIYYW